MPSRMGRVRRAIGLGVVAAWLVGGLPACGEAAHPGAAADGVDTTAPTADAADAADSAVAAEVADAGPLCPTGQVRGLDGVCFPVGIQGCAALFLDEQGLCDPSMSKCPPGTIPKFDEGCVPVGIQGCAERFMEEDGLCHPRMDKCPAGTIPKFDEGCVPVGIQGCAALFMEDDGLCHPRMEKCPAGTIPKFDEGCVPVGIQGCAEVFLEEDGLCHPSMDKCPEDTFAVPQEGCVPIDGPDGCGEGTWGNIGPGPDTYYVDPAYAGDDGDGSRERPGRTIAAVLPLVPEGGRLVLAAGTYDEPLHLTKGIEVVGRCPSMVTISGVQDVGVPVIVLVDGATGAAVRSLTITGEGVGLAVVGSQDATVQRVWIRATSPVGVFVQGGYAVHLDHVLVADTRPDASGSFGRGLDVEEASHVTITGSALVGNRDAGVHVSDAGTVVQVSGVLIEATIPLSGGTDGFGVAVLGGARVALSDSALTRNQVAALFVDGRGSEIEARGNLVAETHPRRADGMGGVGILVQAHAGATLTGNAVLDNRDAGLHLEDIDAQGTVSGNLVVGTMQQEDPTLGGGGLWISGGGSVRVEGNALIANRLAGLDVDGGAVVEGVGNLVEGTLPEEPEGLTGYGVVVEAGAHATLTGNAVVGNQAMGVAVYLSGTSVELTGNLVENTSPRLSDGDLGAGLAAWDGAFVAATGNAFVANTEAGLHLGPDAEVEATGNLVVGTRSRASDGTGGFGIEATGGRVTLEHNAIVANRAAGLAVGLGTDLSATGNLLEDTRERVSDGSAGMGIALYDEATARLFGNAIVSNRNVGLYVEGAEVDASGNLVESTVPSEGTPETGAGVGVGDGAAATLSGNAVLLSRCFGLTVWGDDTWAEATGNLVADTLPGPGAEVTGIGSAVQGGARARLVDNAIVRNHGAGLHVAGRDTQVEVVASLVEGTRPFESGVEWGAGVAAQQGASLTLTSCAVRENHVAALFVTWADVDVSDCALLGTRYAGASFPGDGSAPVDAADGLIAIGFAHVALARTLVSGCARAGILFDSSTGTIARTVSRGGDYGLVFRGTPTPEVGEGNVFTGNSVTDVDANGTLPVPDGPMPLPRMPGVSP